TPVTRKEFDAARRSGAPLFVMLKERADRDPALQEFIRDVQSFAITAGFGTSGELQTQIAQALRTWAVRSGRSAMLRAAGSLPTAPAVDGHEDPFRGAELLVDGEEPVSVKEVVQRARSHVANHRVGEALSELWDLAQTARDIGLGWLAFALLDAAEEIVP